MCSEISPRISFSHDLAPADVVSQPRMDASLLDSASDFEFSIGGGGFHNESTSADELFLNGVILPKGIPGCDPEPLRKVPATGNAKKDTPQPQPPPSSDSEEKPQHRSFWRFGRSSSLNSDVKKGLICSLSLLSRSNSTGSVPNPKRPVSKDAQRNSNSQKQLPYSSPRSSFSYPSSSAQSSLHKPPLKKTYAGTTYGNGVRISPVLNVPPPHLPRGAANLFGLFRNGKDKKNKK